MTSPYEVGGDQSSTLQVPTNKPNGRDDRRNQDASYSSAYPPPRRQTNPSYASYESNQSTLKDSTDMSVRYFSRTPSPTPSEDAALKRKGIIDWKVIAKWRFWFRREWLWYYVAIVIIVVVVALVTIYDKQIVRWLEPTANRIRDLPAGWLIPIAIFFIISFPPLFGHEVLAILVGLVWGLWIGFAITAAGTYLGEVGNFYAFKYLCKARGEKLEKSKIQYACLAKIVRDGGFRVALVARYSAIPGHFTTAIFSTCGMGILVFSLAAILSLPKQFVIVYIGVVLKQEGDDVDSSSDKKNKIISNVVLVITILVTILAMWYLTKKMDAVKHEVIRERRKIRQAKLEANLSSTYDRPYASSSIDRTDVEADASSSVFTAPESDANLPLNPVNTQYQRWDLQGPSGDSDVRAPQPIRPHGPGVVVERIPTFRTESGGGFSMTGERYKDPNPAPSVMREIASDAQHHHGAMNNSEYVNRDMQSARMERGAMELPVIKPSSPFSDSMPEASLSLSVGVYRGQSPAGPTPSSDWNQSGVQLTDPFASSETLITGAKRNVGSNASSSQASPVPSVPHASVHASGNGEERTPIPQQQAFNVYAPPPGPPPGLR